MSEDVARGRGAGLSRRALLVGSVGGAAGLAVAGPAGHAVAATGSNTMPSVPGGRHSQWVTARGGSFRLDGRQFRFGGTNCYYLHQLDHFAIDSMLNDAAAMSLPVVRCWAFADGSGQSYTALQPKPFSYDEAAFEPLDYSVWKAGQLGIRLVMPFVNNWPDYGGMAQYVTWFLGLSDDSFGDAVHHDRFYTDADIKRCYKAYIRHVTHRVNRYTGLRYNDDPTIMTFELANEPRCRSDKSGDTLVAWVKEMSRYVQQQAPHQLVSVGDEGFYGDPTNSDYPYSTFEGVRWKDLIALDSVDYGTVHVYPQGWGETADPVSWGTQWITQHIEDGRRAGKPVVIEEYGLQINASQAIADESARDTGYAAWTTAVESNDGAGDQFWLLTSRIDDGSFYADFDGYRVIWENDPSNTTNALAQQLKAHAVRMAAGKSAT
jgi:mannan endo-1,4-beta-mannosidase